MFNHILLVISMVVCSFSSLAMDDGAFYFKNSGEFKKIYNNIEENYFSDNEFIGSQAEPKNTEVPAQITININNNINYITNINNTVIYPFPSYESYYPWDFANNFSQPDWAGQTESSEEEIKEPEIKPREKLPTSKSPVRDAFLRCVETKDGAKFDNIENMNIKVTNYLRLLDCIKATCSKATPTTDIASRIKALNGHFKGFPGEGSLGKNGFIVSPKDISRYKKYIYNHSM